jgi:hypothetical protein
MPPRGARWLRVALAVIAGVAVGLGSYLLAWAWRWPHSDNRNNGATLLGTFTLLLGVGFALYAARGKQPTSGWAVGVMAVVSTMASAVIALSWFALVVVTEGQEEACGSLPACDSLLPGP